MSKEQYLRKLRSLIRDLPKNERRAAVDFYREIIEDKMESGQSEAQAVAELGDVYSLAQKILGENPNRRHYDGNRVAGIVLASIFGVLIVAAIVVNSLKNANYVSTAGQNPNMASREAGTLITKNETAPVTDTKCVYIDVHNKQITVNRGDGDTIQLTYQGDSSEHFTYTDTDGVMKLVGRTDMDFHFFNFFDWNSRGSVTVTVPEKYAGELYLNSSNARITVDSMPNITKLTCETSNGTVKISDVQAQTMSLSSSNGAIRMVKVTAENVSADTSNGEIELQDLSSPNITLDTSNAGIRGNITGHEEEYNIYTDTSNGSCTPGSRQGGSKHLKANTSNASINITFGD